MVSSGSSMGLPNWKTNWAARGGMGILIAIIVLAPLPLASARHWLWPFFTVALGSLTIWWGLAVLLGRRAVPVPVSTIIVPAVLFMAALVWAVLQTISAVPAGWPHPIWSEVARVLPDHVVPGVIALDPVEALTRSARLLGYGLVFLLSVQYGRDRDRAALMIRTITVAGLFYALYGIAMDIFGIERVLWLVKDSYVGSVTATFINRNHYATFAAMGLICALGLLIQATRRELRGMPDSRHRLVMLAGLLIERHWWLLLAALVQIMAIGMTHSRAGLLSAVVGVFVLILLAGRRYAPDARSGRWFLWGAAIFAVLVLLLSGTDTLDRLGMTVFSGIPRIEIYQLCLRAIADNPLLGYGLGGFPGVAEIYRVSELGDPLVWDFAHNTYLELWLELGLLAGSALIAAVAIILARCLIGALVRRRDAVFAMIAVSVGVTVGLHALVDFSIQMPANAILFSAILGIGHAQARSSRRQ